MAGNEQTAKKTIPPELRTLWLRIRRAWNTNFTAFSNSLSNLDDKQANLVYGLVRLSLFKGSYVEILRANPELKPILLSDEDRLCMMDAYAVLSWRLNRKEPLPPDAKISINMKRKVGRELPDI